MCAYIDSNTHTHTHTHGEAARTLDSESEYATHERICVCAYTYRNTHTHTHSRKQHALNMTKTERMCVCVCMYVWNQPITNQRNCSICMRGMLPNNCHLNPTIYIRYNCLLMNSIQARDLAKTKPPYVPRSSCPQPVPGPQWVYSGRLIVVSARTNKRHHHHQALLRTKKHLFSAILNTTTSSASSPKTWTQSSPNLLTCRYKHAINLLTCDDCSVYSCSFLKRTHSSKRTHAIKRTR